MSLREENDPYAPILEMQIKLPLLYRELCRMLEIEPLQVLVVDFTREIMQPGIFDDGVLTISQAAEYFASIKHKDQLFTPEQVKVMIYDLIVLKSLYPVRREATIESDEYSVMKDAFLMAWKRKWKAQKQVNANKK